MKTKHRPSWNLGFTSCTSLSCVLRKHSRPLEYTFDSWTLLPFSPLHHWCRVKSFSLLDLCGRALSVLYHVSFLWMHSRRSLWKNLFDHIQTGGCTLTPPGETCQAQVLPSSSPHLRHNSYLRHKQWPRQHSAITSLISSTLINWSVCRGGFSPAVLIRTIEPVIIGPPQRRSRAARTA